MRLFVGIPLAAPVVEELTALSLRLQSKGDGLRWYSPESWHITLQFLGNTRHEQCVCLVERLRELRSPPVPVELEGTGFFDRAGIFFAGVNLTPELLSLEQRVTAATSFCGSIPETRPYHPHITLARSKGKNSGRRMHELKSKIRREPNFTKFVAEDFLLYESFPGPAGSRYEIRERFSFAEQ
jgi:RNA 2',3'-cyclic 3'-phosphodiesterase